MSRRRNPSSPDSVTRTQEYRTELKRLGYKRVEMWLPERAVQLLTDFAENQNTTRIRGGIGFFEFLLGFFKSRVSRKAKAAFKEPSEIHATFAILRCVDAAYKNGLIEFDKTGMVLKTGRVNNPPSSE